MRYFIFTILLCAFVLSAHQCSDTQAVISQNHSPSAEITANDHMIMAVLYQQKAAEYRALCYQAFNTGRLAIDMEMRKMGLSRQHAIVVDIDEAVLDNSPAEAACITTGKGYSEFWDRWVDLAAARAVPGAFDFLKYASSKGMQVFYITNRDEKQREATLKNLVHEKFPDADNEHLIMKTSEDSKENRRAEILKKFNIVLLVGDNLADFTGLYDRQTVERRFSVTDSLREEFGRRFIILPNAMYGDWEKALYGFQKLPDSTKARIRKENLAAF